MAALSNLSKVMQLVWRPQDCTQVVQLLNLDCSLLQSHLLQCQPYTGRGHAPTSMLRAEHCLTGTSGVNERMASIQSAQSLMQHPMHIGSVLLIELTLLSLSVSLTTREKGFPLHRQSLVHPASMRLICIYLTSSVSFVIAGCPVG